VKPILACRDALTATEVLLQQAFNLTRPDWLPADYYLGW